MRLSQGHEDAMRTTAHTVAGSVTHVTTTDAQTAIAMQTTRTRRRR